MKKHRGKILLVLLLLLLVGSFTLQDTAARLYVRFRSGDLEAFAQSALAEAGAAPDHYGPWPVSVWPEARIVEFHTQRSAAFGGVEKGFYYSAADTPASFQATGYQMSPGEGGWTWADPYGNHGWTERVLPGWFWFEAVL